MNDLVKVIWQPELENTSMIVGWQADAGKLGQKVINYLNQHIRARTFGEIEPMNFFPLNGVGVEDDVALFPASNFYAGSRKDLVTFVSAEPIYEKYKFLSSVLDIGQYWCKSGELYAIGGIVAPISHTSPLRLLAAYNQPELQKRLRNHELDDLTWEGPPVTNSFLLWLAQQRGIPAVILWPEISFYLSATEAPKAVKSVLSFFNKRFGLDLDFTTLDLDIKSQNEKLALLRRENSQVDKYIRTLEVGMSLDDQEQLTLAQTVTDFLEKTAA